MYCGFRYEINECLWNKNLREYKDRDERISSIQSISDEMKISIEEINKKIHNLRNQYRFELNKTKKKIPGKPRYTTKWYVSTLYYIISDLLIINDWDILIGLTLGTYRFWRISSQSVEATHLKTIATVISMKQANTLW